MVQCWCVRLLSRVTDASTDNGLIEVWRVILLRCGCVTMVSLPSCGVCMLVRVWNVRVIELWCMMRVVIVRRVGKNADLSV